MGDVRDGFTAERIELGTGPIHYREIGEGPAIVFVHGYPVNGRIWDETARALAPAHRCIVPDWPLGGHSEAMSPDADLSPHGVARLVSEFLAALELDDATIVGNDAGGAISQMLVTERPDRIGRLVLTNCDCFEKFPPRRFKPMIAIARSRSLYRVMIKSMQVGPLQRSPLAFGSLSTGGLDDEMIRSFMAPSERNPDVREDGRKFLAGGDVEDTLGAAAKLPNLEIRHCSPGAPTTSSSPWTTLIGSPS